MTICQRVLADCRRVCQRVGGRELFLEELRCESRGEGVGEHLYSRPHASAEEILEQLEAVGQLRAALAALPEQERQVVKLHFIEGLSFRWIADFLALSVDCVKRACKSVLDRLRQQLSAVCAG